jgi:hypothetical protein
MVSVDTRVARVDFSSSDMARISAAVTTRVASEGAAPIETESLDGGVAKSSALRAVAASDGAEEAEQGRRVWGSSNQNSNEWLGSKDNRGSMATGLIMVDRKAK